jgi:type IV secretion system protein VirD4
MGYAIFCRLLLLSSGAVLALAAGLMAWRVPWLAILVVGYLLWRGRRGSYYGWVHGTAYSASPDDLYDGGFVGGDQGLILGRMQPMGERLSKRAAVWTLLTAPLRHSAVACHRFVFAYFGERWVHGPLVRLTTFMHLAMFAPTGRGKGVSYLVTNLLSYPHSVVVPDPKGELFNLTAKHRMEKFNHKIIRLDAFEVCGPGSDTLNPIDMIDRDSVHTIDQARELANAIVIRTGFETEPTWNDNAELVLTAIISFVAAMEHREHLRNLQTVRQLLASRQRYNACILAMQKSKACGGMLARLGHLLTWHVDRELGSILSTVHRHTAFLDSPIVAASTLRSSFDPRLIRRSEQPTTTYLILPQDRVVTQSGLMRLWVVGMVRGIASAGANERNSVLFLLDEMGQIGHIQILEDAVTLMRGYGIRLFFVFQSLGQLAKCFGTRATVFLDNIDTQIFFGVNTLETAEFVSKRMGVSTIRTHSTQTSTSWSRPTGGSVGQNQGSLSGSTTISTAEQARPLAFPDEVIRQSENTAIIFHRNLPPIFCRLAKYFNSPEFARGGTGQSSRLGRSATVASLLALAFSGLTLFTAASVPLPVPAPAPERSNYTARQPANASSRNPYAYRRRPWSQRPDYMYEVPGWSEWMNSQW